MSNVIAQFHKGKYVNKPVQLGTTLAKDVILEDGDSVDAKFRRLVCNSNGELAFKGKNVVRSVNGVTADKSGNVEIKATSFLTGQLIQSIVPLDDAMLHLADGALLNGDGVYSEFVAFMVQKVASTPNLFCTEEEWQASNSSYGECGKFVYDANANTIRLPKINGYLTVTNNQEDLGKLTEAGLPNITGSVGAFYNLDLPSGAFYQGENAPNWTDAGVGSNTYKMFDASRSSSVYGNSETVTTQNIKVFCYVVLGTVTKSQIQVDIDNVLSDLANKANKDFSNVTAPTQAFKNMSVGWCMPDWSKVIDITTSKNSYTAPIDGWVFGVLGFTDTYCNAYINGYNIGRESNDYISMQSPLNAGDVFTSNANVGILYFLPCKGVN